MTNNDLSPIIFAHKKNIIEDDIKKIKYIKLSTHKNNSKKGVLFDTCENMAAKKVHSILRTTKDIKQSSITIHGDFVLFPAPNWGDIPWKRWGKYFVYFLNKDQATECMYLFSGKKGYKDIKLFGPEAITKYDCLTPGFPRCSNYDWC